MSLSEFNLVCTIWAAVAVFSFILLQFVTAPYGRHVARGWGIEIPNKLGWIFMEAPSLFIILFFYLFSDQSSYASLLSILWIIHYINRTFIYPFRIRTKGKVMPFAIVGSAIFFNFINAGLNGYYLAFLETYDSSTFFTSHFYLGFTLFIIGFLINQKSDTMLIHLRKPGETGYKIPKGFLFKYVSCPNLFGELIQWTGFAIMAMNPAATCFLIWTAANLIPRALSHHKWYREKFENYPSKRKALIPFVL
jgi:3-oxo-5-alpha-steroid 4-dehydrogenase 1